MNELFTPVRIKESPTKWGIRDTALCLGSCFAAVIGDNLKGLQIETSVNPFGILFDPVSLLNLFIRTLKDEPEKEELFYRRENIWHHHDWHSSVRAHSKLALKKTIENKKNELKSWLLTTDWLLLTFGTAITHSLQGASIANCHKRNQKDFEQSYLDTDSIQNLFAEFYQLLSCKRIVRPQIILTVSPIRHTRSGMVQNSMSKAILRVACGNIAHSFDSVNYFPSFEILMDELRDYRFYSDDLIHPNKTSERIIWERFRQCFFNSEMEAITKIRSEIITIERHKPQDELAWNKLKQVKLKALTEKLEMMYN